MKILRSSKATLKFTTRSKRHILEEILKEYSKVVNFFIDRFWENTPKKYELLKGVYNLSSTCLSSAMKQLAAREAIDMILASKNRDKEKAIKPVHKGNKIQATQLICNLNISKQAKNFDSWVHLKNIGCNIILDIPIKFHKHF